MQGGRSWSGLDRASVSFCVFYVIFKADEERESQRESLIIKNHVGAPCHACASGKILKCGKL